MSKYQVLSDLRQGNTVEYDGLLLVMDGDGAVRDGDTYIAERNTVQLLTAREVNHERSWIVPEENAYAFDTWECVRVRIAE